MADSIRQKIIDAVAARFASITTGNGYETNIGSKVYVWRNLEASPLDANDLPAINIRDPKCETQQQTSGVHTHMLHIEAVVMASKSTTESKTVRKMIADVTKAVGVDRQWTVSSVKLAFDTDPVKDETTIEQHGDITGAAKISFIIKFRTRSFDPYNSQ
jgi:hypothetical protein